MSGQTENPFKYKVRVRVCGLLIKEDRVLLLKHNTIGPEGYLWSPPGGGVEFGETMEETLIKEFKEETNLSVEVGKYLFANEFIGKEHHAIEMFFLVNHISGELKLGSDPELPDDEQILTEARFISFKELMGFPKGAIHNAFHAAETRDKIEELHGLLTFKH